MNSAGIRSIPINEEIRKVLSLAEAIDGDSEYIFHPKGKDTMLSTSVCNYSFKKRCEELGLDATGLHALRRTYICNSCID